MFACQVRDTCEGIRIHKSPVRVGRVEAKRSAFHERSCVRAFERGPDPAVGVP